MSKKKPKLLENLTEPELSAVMKTTGRAIFGVLELVGVEKPLFLCLVFNDPRITQYVSNCDRHTMIEAMREAVKRMEADDDVPRD